VTVAPADAEVAAVEVAAILGGGFREGTAPGGAVELDFWVPAGAADPARLRATLAARGIEAGVALAVEDPAWMNAMRRFHRPVEIAGRVLVRPPWEPPRPPLLDVEIDPGMAFGTAQHATTRACLELLCGLPPGGPLVDAGCGSGILAIAARRLGFDPVWAFDMDPLAVEATIANARVNGVGLTVARRVIGADRPPAAPVVLANLTGTVLTMLAGALEPPGPRWLIASGMRPEEVPAVAGAFSRLGLCERRAITDEGWSSVLLGRP
jgi:ribosomal protein L11 methyltransferase